MKICYFCEELFADGSIEMKAIINGIPGSIYFPCCSECIDIGIKDVQITYAFMREVAERN